MNTPARSQNQLSLWATHVLPSVYSIRKHVSIRSSSSDQFGSSFVLGPLSGNRTLPSILLPVIPSFGPGLDLGVSVSKRPPTAADNLLKSVLEASSVGVDGMFSLASTLLPSWNHLLPLSEGHFVDLCSLFLKPTPVAMRTPGRTRARCSFYKYIT